MGPQGVFERPAPHAAAQGGVEVPGTGWRLLLRLTGAARMERDDDGMAGQACLLRGVCLGVPHFRHADYVRSQP